MQHETQTPYDVIHPIRLSRISVTTFLAICLMTLSLLDDATLQLNKWCRRKELNLRLRVRSSVPWSVGRRLQIMVGEGRIELPPLVPRTRMPAITLLPEIVGAASQDRTAFSGFSDQRNHQTYASSKYLVETEGVEPPTSECKTDVLPLAPRPRIVGAG